MLEHIRRSHVSERERSSGDDAIAIEINCESKLSAGPFHLRKQLLLFRPGSVRPGKYVESAVVTNGVVLTRCSDNDRIPLNGDRLPKIIGRPPIRCQELGLFRPSRARSLKNVNRAVV